MRSISVLVFLLIVCAVIAFAYVRHSAALQPESYQTYIVEGGDTLWGIAKNYAPRSMDLRDYIYRLRQLNNLHESAIIHPGQALKLPVARR